MNVTITPKKEESQVELHITTTVEEFRPFLEKASEALSKEHPLKGFRPGKAPVNIVAEHIGTERLLKEAMDAALPHFFIQAAVDNDVKAINRPAIAIEELGIDKPLQFIATVDVLPEVTLGDPDKVEVEKRPISISDEELDEELAYIAKSRSKTLEVTRPAQEQDLVEVDFEVRVNGELIEGGESKRHPLVLGEGYFVPDFEKKILGMTAGEKREFTITFPDDFPKEQLRGKNADVVVQVHSVQKRVVPEINDEFAKEIGSFESAADLKKQLKENIQNEKKEKEKERFLGEVAEKFADKTTFGPIPSVLVEKEIDRRMNEFSTMLAYQQKTLEDYMQEHGSTTESMRDNMRESAEKHIKIGLTLSTFAEQHNIEPEEKEIEEEVQKQLSRFSSTEEANKEVDPEELRDYVISILKNRKTLEKLSTLVKVTETKD